MRFRGAGGKLEHVGSFLSQTPAVQDFTVTFLKVVELERVGRVQQSGEGKDKPVTPVHPLPSLKTNVCLARRQSYVTSCSCRAAPALVPGDLCNTGFHSDSPQERIRPRGWCVQGLGLRTKCKNKLFVWREI